MATEPEKYRAVRNITTLLLAAAVLFAASAYISDAEFACLDSTGKDTVAVFRNKTVVYEFRRFDTCISIVVPCFLSLHDVKASTTRKKDDLKVKANLVCFCDSTCRDTIGYLRPGAEKDCWIRVNFSDFNQSPNKKALASQQFGVVSGYRADIVIDVPILPFLRERDWRNLLRRSIESGGWFGKRYASILPGLKNVFWSYPSAFPDTWGRDGYIYIALGGRYDIATGEVSAILVFSEKGLLSAVWCPLEVNHRNARKMTKGYLYYDKTAAGSLEPISAYIERNWLQAKGIGIPEIEAIGE
jgi:hypothetical protein